MTLVLDPESVVALRTLAEASYPAEGAGLILGTIDNGDLRRVIRVLPLENRWETGEQRRRYRLDPRDLMQAEDQAEQNGLLVLGVFHSHPDHPARPSEFDLERALPFYTYLITSVKAGSAVESRAWRLAEDRGAFIEETVLPDLGPEETA